MHGAQGPGGPREGIAPERARSGTSGRSVYARRRILAILVLLLLLALLVPRACQALLGSDEDAGSRQDRQAGAAGAATEAGAEEGGAEDADAGSTDAGNTDAEKSEDNDPSSRGAPFVEDDEPDGEGASGTEDGDEAAPDLAAMVTDLAVSDGGEGLTGGDGQSPGADPPSPSGAGGEPPADAQPMSEIQFALAASRTPVEQPADTRRTPSTESEPADRAAPAAPPRAERVRDRGDLIPPTPVVAPGGPEERRGVRRTAIEPVLAEPVTPAPIPTGRAFVGNPGGGVANNYGGNTGGVLNGALAFNRAGAAPRAPAVHAAPAAPLRGPGSVAAGPAAFRSSVMPTSSR